LELPAIWVEQIPPYISPTKANKTEGKKTQKHTNPNQTPLKSLIKNTKKERLHMWLRPLINNHYGLKCDDVPPPSLFPLQPDHFTTILVPFQLWLAAGETNTLLMADG